MNAEITFRIDTGTLPQVTDRYLAALWHIAQANPAPIEDAGAGDLAEYIGREIIRRFLAATPPELWAHQERHAEFCKRLALQQAEHMRAAPPY